MGELIIKCRKELGDFALDIFERFSLDGITAIFGPSGAGKSTILKLIAGLETPDEGEIKFKDALWDMPPHKRRAGYMFQSGALFPHLSVKGNLAFTEKRSRDIESAIKFDSVIETLNLGALLERNPQTLSGGERQRAALARILLSRPKILLLDEPLSGLDRRRKAEILPLLKSLPKDFALPCLYVSHDIEEVTALANHILILDHGRVQAHGPAMQILNQIDRLPLAQMDIDPGRVFDAVITLIKDGMMTVRIGGAELLLPHQTGLSMDHHMRLKIRAQDVSLATSKPKGLSIQNCLKGKITSLLPLTDSPFVDVSIRLDRTLETTPELKSRITKLAAGDLKLSVGKSVYTLIKSASLQR